MFFFSKLRPIILFIFFYYYYSFFNLLCHTLTKNWRTFIIFPRFLWRRIFFFLLENKFHFVEGQAKLNNLAMISSNITTKNLPLDCGTIPSLSLWILKENTQTCETIRQFIKSENEKILIKASHKIIWTGLIIGLFIQISSWWNCWNVWIWWISFLGNPSMFFPIRIWSRWLFLDNFVKIFFNNLGQIQWSPNQF